MSCCKELKNFIRTVDKVGYILGEGVDGCGAGFNEQCDNEPAYISLSDGFDSAHLNLNYCPFCGKKQVKK